MSADQWVRFPRSKGRSRRPACNTRRLFHETLEDRSMLAQTTGLLMDSPAASDGYTLFSPNTSNIAYLIDEQGHVVHQWTTDFSPGLLGYLLPDGSLITDVAPHGQGGNGSINSPGAGGLIERYDWAGNKIWQYSYDSPTHLAHHDFRVLPNGNILIIAWELKSATEATQAGRNPTLPGPGYLYPDSIVEVQPDLVNGGGNIVWEWHVWDHLVQQYDSSKSNYYGPAGVQAHPELINLNYVSTADEGAGAPQDWNHTNGIDYNADLDQIVVSVREFSELWIIDHSTTTAQAASHSGGNSGKGGDLLYRWGNPQTYGAGTASDRVFYYQHNARWIPDGSPGAGDLTVINNGYGRPGPDYTSVEEITPPVDGGGHYALTAGSAYGPATTTWTYAATAPGEFTPIIGGAQRLPDGNTLITYGVDGTFSEVTPAGQEVWKYVNPYTGYGTIGPTDPIPSLGIADPLLSSLDINFVFRAIEYPLGYVSQLTSTVAGRNLFYSGSGYDKQTNTALPWTPLAFSDDNAIATDKSAYLPGSGAATFANVSSYSQGINGIMVDLLGGGSHSSITGSDFIFKAGNSAAVDGTWTTLSGANLPTVSVRLGMTGSANGAGTVSGSDRVELVWALGTTLPQKWLEVIVLADADTGLAANDVFFFGSEIGDANKSNLSTIFKVTSVDTTSTQTHVSPVGNNNPISNVFDFNRDGAVGTADITLDQTHGTTNSTGLVVINIPGGGPFAPPPPGAALSTSSGQAVMASALVSSSQSPVPPAVPPWIVKRLSDLDLSAGPITKYFEHLAHENTAQSRATLVKAEHITAALHLDDTLLNSLLANLGIE